MSLSCLGDDILITVIPQYLSPQDIFNFSIVNKDFYDRFYNSSFTATLYKVLYNKKFTNNDNHLQPKTNRNDGLTWKQLFRLRTDLQQKIYTWGSNGLGRLGYLFDAVPPAYVTSKRGVHTASNIEQFNHHIITDISATGFSFVVLLNSGQLYFTGQDWRRTIGGTPMYEAPGPRVSDYYPPPSSFALSTLSNNPRTLTGRQSLFPLPAITLGNRYDREVQPGLPSGRRMQIQPILTRPPEELPEIPGVSPSTSDRHGIKETNFITELKLPPEHDNNKLISVSSGRQHILALDDANNLYTWDSGVPVKIGANLKFGELEPLPPVTKIFAGWNISGLYVPEIGLVVWHSRSPITKEQFEAGDHTSEAMYYVIPGTKRDIEDFTLGDNFVIFTKRSDGKLYRSELVGDSYLPTEAISNFNEWLNVQQINDGITRKFTRLNCCFRNWVVFTDNDEILIGNNKNDITVIEELQHQNVKSIEIGDYHFLALTNHGEVLSWGRESGQCGCLGLGSKSKVLAEDSSVRDLGTYEGIEVFKPKKIINPTPKGKWVQIACSGWHSGGIYVAEEEI